MRSVVRYIYSTYRVTCLRVSSGNFDTDSAMASLRRAFNSFEVHISATNQVTAVARWRSFKLQSDIRRRRSENSVSPKFPRRDGKVKNRDSAATSEPVSFQRSVDRSPEAMAEAAVGECFCRQ